MFHFHKWTEIGRSYCPPHTGFKATSILVAELEKIMSGYTVIGLKCEKCGDIKSSYLIGKFDLESQGRKA